MRPHVFIRFQTSMSLMKIESKISYAFRTYKLIDTSCIEFEDDIIYIHDPTDLPMKMHLEMNEKVTLMESCMFVSVVVCKGSAWVLTPDQHLTRVDIYVSGHIQPRITLGVGFPFKEEADMKKTPRDFKKTDVEKIRYLSHSQFHVYSYISYKKATKIFHY